MVNNVTFWAIFSTYYIWNIILYHQYEILYGKTATAAYLIMRTVQIISQNLAGKFGWKYQENKKKIIFRLRHLGW